MFPNGGRTAWASTNLLAATLKSSIRPPTAASPNVLSLFTASAKALSEHSVWHPKHRARSASKTFWPCSWRGDRHDAVRPILHLQSPHAAALEPGWAAGVRLHQVRKAGARIWAVMGHEGANDSAGKEALTCTGKIGIFYVTGSTGTPRMRKHRCGGFFWPKSDQNFVK